MKMRLVSSFLVGLLLVAGAAAWGQTPEAQETESSVPALTAFHEIIYPIWHTAYPDKDYAALRSFAPDVKKLAENVYAAELPGILRDKQAKWDQALDELRKSVDAYLAATSGSDDAALLDAAEVLHARYEMMVRTIRPVLREVDTFHKTLYVVYHKYLPNKDFGKIAEVSAEMLAQAEAITKTSLPKRLESKTQAFSVASLELHEATTALVEAGKSGEGKAISAAVEKVHTKYQALEKIFD
jgi:NADH dehydrogenase/NADH:ubiquinone oxidoreductase subunit G